jgi:hypothetical protein
LQNVVLEKAPGHGNERKAVADGIAPVHVEGTGFGIARYCFGLAFQVAGTCP